MTDSPTRPGQVEVRDGIAVVTIDNPPVNALSSAVRAFLIESLVSAAGSADVRGVVLTGRGRDFVAGSDLKEFDGDIPLPLLPEVVSVIERLAIPVIAAIDGHALGGGLELAMACDARVATVRARFGLPEVTLGFVPGCGGTQRLPRLVGALEAARMIAYGERIDAESAHRLGLVDGLVAESGDLLAAACALVDAGASKARLLDRMLPAGTPALLEEWWASQPRKVRSDPAAREALDLIAVGSSIAGRDALELERAAFTRLRASDASRAARHLFFSERAALSRASAGREAADRIRKVGVVGAGRMGQGIARLCASVGFDVVVTDNSDAVRERARVEGAAYRVVDQLDDLRDCDLVIEAVVENSDIKSALFRDLDAIVGPHTVLATNTSYLGVGELSRSVADPARFAGLHFFNPADRMRALEVVAGAETSAATVGTLLAVGRRLGKVPVPAGDRQGFIGNRMLSAYRRHCEFLIQDGATPEQVDRAIEGIGFAMGPFAVADLSGLDIAQAFRRQAESTRPAGARTVDIPDLLIERGRVGRSSGRGYFRYDDANAARVDDGEVLELIEESSRRAGISRRRFSAAELADRACFAFFNEAALLLEEGIADRAGDVDLVAVNGLGFPKALGGPLWWGAQQSPERVEAGLDALQAASGAEFRRAGAEALAAARAGVARS